MLRLSPTDVPVKETFLPQAHYLGQIPGPEDAAILQGRLWSNMLVFWLQKFVALDSNGQSRIYNIATGDSGARNIWEKHKASLRLTSPLVGILCSDWLTSRSC